MKWEQKVQKKNKGNTKGGDKGKNKGKTRRRREFFYDFNNIFEKYSEIYILQNNALDRSTLTTVVFSSP